MRYLLMQCLVYFIALVDNCPSYFHTCCRHGVSSCISVRIYPVHIIFIFYILVCHSSANMKCYFFPNLDFVSLSFEYSCPALALKLVTLDTVQLFREKELNNGMFCACLWRRLRQPPPSPPRQLCIGERGEWGESLERG